MANKFGEPSRGLFPPTSVLHPVTHIPSPPSPAPPACHQPGFVLFLLTGMKQKVIWGEELTHTALVNHSHQEIPHLP